MATPPAPSASTLPFRLKFRQLVLLDALGDSLSLRKAAALANLTQPAATRAMAELESAFGVQLFERSHRGMAPTVYGEALVRLMNAETRMAMGDREGALAALHAAAQRISARADRITDPCVRAKFLAVPENARTFELVRVWGLDTSPIEMLATPMGIDAAESAEQRSVPADDRETAGPAAPRGAAKDERRTEDG